MKAKILAFSLLILLTSGCTSLKPSPPPPQMSEVESVRAAFPIYPDFVQIPDNFRVAAPNIASLGLKFKSNAPFEDVKRFYVEKLTRDGWQLEEDRKLSDWGRDMGGRLLEFQKGEYQISIEKAGRNNNDWGYAINFSWNKL